LVVFLRRATATVTPSIVRNSTDLGSDRIMLGSHKPGAEWCREPGTAGGYIMTTDPAAIYERVQQRHADVVRPIAETDYGAGEFAMRDPEGNMWSFGDYQGAPLPA
jgi:uncharacterized glyoxalase superfamily protein PhnB